MDAKEQKTDWWSKYTPVLVGLGLIICFAVIQMRTDRFAGNDGYYHIKYAWLLWHELAIWDFPWLRGTFFHESWVDTEFLYHVLLIPFTLPGDLYLAGKVAPVFMASVALFSVYWVIRSFGAEGSAWQKHAWWAAILLMAASNAALYRMSMPRVPAASLTFMMISILLLEQKQWKWLAVLGFFYAWMYPVSVVLIPLSLFYAFGDWYDRDKWNLRPVAAVTAGVAIGFIINPYFPRTLPILFNHVVEIGIGTSDLPKGNEWAPYDSWFMFYNAKVAWTALFIGGLCLVGTPARGRHIALLAATAMMMFAYFKSRRFVEYWPFFAVLFSASTFYDALHSPTSLLNRVRRAVPETAVLFVVMMVTALLAGFGVQNIKKTSKEISVNAKPTRLAGAAQWLQENTPQGTQVYNVEWDIFPELIFYNHHNYWTLGLDPNFTYEVDPKLYHTAVGVGGGSVDQPGRFIKQYFGAEYVLALAKTTIVSKAKAKRAGLKEVYKDDNAVVFKIVPATKQWTVQPELEPNTSDLASKSGVCRYGNETFTIGGPSAFLQCWLKKPVEFTLRYKAHIVEAGQYRVTGKFLTGAAPGTVEVLVREGPVGPPLDLAADKRKMKGWNVLGTRVLRAGPADVALRFKPQMPDDFAELKGKRAKWPIEVGVDAVRLARIK